MKEEGRGVPVGEREEGRDRKGEAGYADDIAIMSTANLVDGTLHDLQPLEEQLDL